MKVNAVFQGGGVKAIGLAGAVTAAQKCGFQFHNVAGTSSGSIVAAMLAAGYSGEEMGKIIAATPFSSFLKKSWLHQAGWVGSTIRLLIKQGMYSGEALEQWVYDVLAAKGIKTFGDLRPNQLRIIASDISQGKLMVLPDDIAEYGINPRKFLIAKAIRMSTSIPYFFDPVIIRKGRSVLLKGDTFRKQFVYIVDGGILSNFPLWLFDNEDEKSNAPLPTLGFQLVGSGKKEPREISGPISMLQALFATMMDAHDERYIEEYNDFRTIKIPTLGVHTTQFSITREESMELYRSGEKAAQKFCGKWSIEAYLKNAKLYEPPAIV